MDDFENWVAQKKVKISRKEMLHSRADCKVQNKGNTREEGRNKISIEMENIDSVLLMQVTNVPKSLYIIKKIQYETLSAMKNLTTSILA